MWLKDIYYIVPFHNTNILQFMDDVDNDDGNDDVANAFVVVVVCSRVLTSYHYNGKPAILLNSLLKIQVSFGLSSII